MNEWLSQQQGSVSKADIQKYLKDNRIQVVEVVLGKDDYRNLPEYKEADQKAFEAASAKMEAQQRWWESKKEEDFDEIQRLDKELEKWTRIKQGIEKRKEQEGVTKFSQYQLEGDKSNYKEVLVTMPENSPFVKEVKRLSTKYGIEPSYLKLRNPESGATDEELKNLRSLEKQEQFKSSHWDEPNILVHLRMNTRTDADGNKVLFLEEVQSDWGQKGKKEGFEQGDKTYKISDFRKEKQQDGSWVVYGSDGRAWWHGSTEERANQTIQDYINSGGITKTEKSIPTAPFVTDTNAWTKLGLKVALKEAVAQGADKISWTTGEQQNERYDLSKHVDKVYYNPKTKEFGYFIKGEKNPQIHLKTEPNKIADYVGKDIAERLMQEPQKDGMHELNGDGLQVGGSGMKGFYGSPTENKLGIVGNVAKKLFGQEPSAITLQDGTTQHAVSITPEMREQVQEGQPLFQKEGANTSDKTENKRRMEKISMKAFTDLFDKLKKAFPKMNISYTFDWEEFVSKHKALQGFKSLEDAISEIEKKLGIQFMQLPDGTIYGAVLPDGTMYFNPEHLNANTPIHEHTHLFNQVIQKTNLKLWNRMVEAVKGIGLWNEAMNKRGSLSNIPI